LHKSLFQKESGKKDTISPILYEIAEITSRVADPVQIFKLRNQKERFILSGKYTFRDVVPAPLVEDDE
jgi:hypothetical protein